MRCIQKDRKTPTEESCSIFLLGHSLKFQGTKEIASIRVSFFAYYLPELVN